MKEEQEVPPPYRSKEEILKYWKGEDCPEWILYAMEQYAEQEVSKAKLPPSSLNRSGSQPGKDEVSMIEVIKRAYAETDKIDVADTELNEEKCIKAYQVVNEIQDILGIYLEGDYELWKKEYSQPSQPREGNNISHYVGILTDESPLPEQGKKEVDKDILIKGLIYDRDLYKMQVKNFADTVGRMGRELAALKSKPTDGWSAPSEEEINRAAREYGWNAANGGDNHSDTFKAAIQWLSSYKAKQVNKE